MRVLFSFFIIFFFINCGPDEGIVINEPYDLKVPGNFPALVYNAEHNPLTIKGIELGRKIFYDKQFSSDKNVSCASCHIQKVAFSDAPKSLSLGVNGKVGNRNSPPIQNMAFQSQFMWDGAADHLELVSMIPITSDVEMNATFTEIIKTTNKDNAYTKLVKDAFDIDKIDGEHFLKAIAQFLTIMISSNSKYDKFIRNEGVYLTENELKGLNLFKQKCSSCHSTDIFTNNTFKDNGLPLNPEINDYGRYRVTEKEEDKFKFKVPSLRNIELTSPYMHDARFLTLEEVLDHYEKGIEDRPSLASELHNNNSVGISLTIKEKQQIIAFLKTLTDDEFINNEMFKESYNKN